MKARSLILAALVLAASVPAAANPAHACNEDCRAIFTEPLSRKTTEGTDELCEMRREACHSCAREKAHDAGVTLECANCVIDEAEGDLSRCVALCGGAEKTRTTYFAAGCL